MVEFLLIMSECFIDFRKKIEFDEGFQQLRYIIKNGWLEIKEEVLLEIRGYFNFKEEFSIY